MTAMSDYLENKLIDALLRGQAYTMPTTVYVGLMTTNENDAAGGTEVSGSSYARAAITSATANWSGTQSAGSTVASTGTSGTVSNNGTVSFPTPTGSWGTVTGFGIFDASSGGNLLIYSALTASQTIGSGNTVSFPAGTLTFQIDN